MRSADGRFARSGDHNAKRVEDRRIKERPMEEPARSDPARALLQKGITDNYSHGVVGKETSSLKRRQEEPEIVNAKRLIGNSLAVGQASVKPDLTSAAAVMTPAREAKHISALMLAEQVEAVAHSLGLHDIQSKAAGVVQELELQNKTICPRKFHRAVAAVWAHADDEKVKKYSGESVDVKKFFKSLRLNLIRPLGRELVANTLVFIEKKIKQFEEENTQEVLSIELIKENLESLLELATNN